MNKLQKVPLLEKQSTVLPITQQPLFPLSYYICGFYRGKKETENYGLNKFAIYVITKNVCKILTGPQVRHSLWCQVICLFFSSWDLMGILQHSWWKGPYVHHVCVTHVPKKIFHKLS